MFGFNSQLYSNFSEAVYRSHGIVAISILLQVCIFNTVTVKTFYVILYTYNNLMPTLIMSVERIPH